MTPRHDGLVPILPAEPAPSHRLPTSEGRLDPARLREIMERTEAGPVTLQEREEIRQALSAGVVPRFGLRHLAVGRRHEREVMIEDLERMARGGASVRLVIGENGAGKTLLRSSGWRTRRPTAPRSRPGPALCAGRSTTAS